MKVALVQMDIAWELPSKNRETAERLMMSAEKSDIYVLPEMWNTGVTTEPMGVAEDENGETLQWMQRMANQLDAAVAGSVAVHLPDGTYRNRLYFVKPQENVQCSMFNGTTNTISSPMAARRSITPLATSMLRWSGEVCTFISPLATTCVSRFG